MFMYASAPMPVPVAAPGDRALWQHLLPGLYIERSAGHHHHACTRKSISTGKPAVGHRLASCGRRGRDDGAAAGRRRLGRRRARQRSAKSQSAPSTIWPHTGRLPEETAAYPGRRLAPHRRHGRARRRRLFAPGRPQEGRHHHRRPERLSQRRWKRCSTATPPWPRPRSSACPIEEWGEAIKAVIQC